LRIGRSRVDPINAQVVFLLAGPIGDELKNLIIDWWGDHRERAHQDGLELLQPDFLLLGELSASDYRQLDPVDVSTYSPVVE
jgi:hypothetical protein